MAEHCTYIYIDPKNRAPVYVGEGQGRRPLQHLKNSHCTRLSRLLKKRVQEGFTVVPVIVPAESKQDAQEMEMLLIATRSPEKKAAFAQKLSATARSLCWVTDGKQTQRVNKNQLNDYLARGYQRGRKLCL